MVSSWCWGIVSHREVGIQKERQPRGFKLLRLHLHPRFQGTPGLLASLVAQAVKNLSAMQKTWVQSLGWEDPLEKGMATHSSILGWRIP